jgi:hypothetical protein
MTIDERLERLTQRHEALAESIELLTADVRANAEAQRANAEAHRALEQQTAARFAETLQFINRLARPKGRPAEAHERRLDDLEDRR